MKARLLAEDNRKWWTLASVSFALFMIMLDNTVVNVALPTIQKDLGIGVAELEWVVTGYALSFAVLMLTGGKVADMFGRRRVFLIGLAVFTLASLLCGLAGSAELLIAARVLQGVGAACMMPATLSIITATFPPRERGAALGIWAGVSAMALAIGPLVGGLITEHISWNWIFYINVPVGLVGLVAARLIIRESKDTSHEQRLDLPGPADVRDRPVRSRLRADRGEQPRVDVAAHPRPVRRRARRRNGVRHARAAPAGADVRPEAVPQPDVRRRQHRCTARLARDVRRVLLHLALHAERARLQRRSCGCGVPADDHPDHPRRAPSRASRRIAWARGG